MECLRCHLVLKNKYSLVRHLKKKIACVDTTNNPELYINTLLEQLITKEKDEKIYICKFCDFEFADKSNKCRHERNICTKRNTTNTTTTTNTYNITINNNINNPTIIVNGLGAESQNYLTEDVIKSLLNSKVDGVMKVLHLKHLNDAIPENKNIQKKVHRDKFIEYYDGDQWKSSDDSILKDVFKNIGKDVMKFLKDNKNIKLDTLTEEQQMRVIHNFMDQVGIPLDWFKLFDSELLKKHKDTYELKIEERSKNKRKIYDIATENIYRYTKYKECPF